MRVFALPVKRRGLLDRFYGRPQSDTSWACSINPVSATTTTLFPQSLLGFATHISEPPLLPPIAWSQICTAWVTAVATPCLLPARYDNAFLFDGWYEGRAVASVGQVFSPITGIGLTFATDQPSVQMCVRFGLVCEH